jgi:putative peptide maturation system protein
MLSQSKRMIPATDFGTVLAEGAAFLRTLPRRRGDDADARALMADWCAAHPGVDADLAIDQPPGSTRIDFDLLVEHPDGGTIALTWRPDDGLPWEVCYADHHAADSVLSVNGHNVTIQQAMRTLRMAADTDRLVATGLVDQALMLQIVEADKAPVTPSELQAASDRFRRQAGLLTADAMTRWLGELGMTQAQFEALLETTVKIRRLRHRVTSDGIEPYFQAHRRDYDRIRYFDMSAGASETAERLATNAGQGAGLLGACQNLLARCPSLDIRADLNSGFAATVAEPLRAAAPGSVVGPYRNGERFHIAQVIGRSEAVLDGETAAIIRETLYQEWLAGQRENAMIVWHWS